MNRIKNYYEIFSDKYLLKDLKKRNLRQAKIAELIYEFVRKNSIVLDVGCGIGINARELLKKTTHLTCLDLSKNNIKKTKLLINNPKVQYIQADVITWEYDKYFDVITLFDIIEHIPKEELKIFFEKIFNLLNDDGIVIMSFPSPEYQNYLKEYETDSLQIIDENIYITDLFKSNFKIVYFKYLDVWHKNQYCHAVLSKKVEFQRNRHKHNKTLFKKLFMKQKRNIRNKYWFLKNIPALFRIYKNYRE